MSDGKWSPLEHLCSWYVALLTLFAAVLVSHADRILIARIRRRSNGLRSHI